MGRSEILSLAIVLGGCAAGRPVVTVSSSAASEAGPALEEPSAVLPFDPAVAWGGPTGEGTYRIAYRPDPSTMPEGEVFSLEVLVLRGGSERAVPGAMIEVDARMPDHGHGMITVPRVERTGDGHFLVDGMLFQMPGLWELTVDVVEDGVAERATFAIELE
jgi:hypothetical protein